MRINSSGNQNPKLQVLRSPGESRVGQRKGDSISTNRPVGWLLEGSHQLPSGPMGCLLEEPTEDLHMVRRGCPPPGNVPFSFLQSHSQSRPLSATRAQASHINKSTAYIINFIKWVPPRLNSPGPQH